MSDVSILSNQYNQLVATSDKVNNSVITFKKEYLLTDKSNKDKYPKLAVSAEEHAEAKKTLTAFLDNIKKIMDDNELKSDFIPSLIILDYKDRLSQHHDLENGLKTLIDRVANDQPIENKELLVLDDLLTVLDSERSTLFRKLRKGRG
ncbi:hypothetical protein [Mucilaginibacter polytrichastri]|uniref:Uncharacterized protein n=1 Tax=Mucilaginibacter polytrichastri TaxID=1302689 RepID=A0A1Q5ZS53_9SPHI|nr:hypothetical protein [Mucilaginibacter polytrichastri]OKS84594.1 hypothetical protein RG47T_0026 [Mucilaginibacter polytrichastri]SFT02547.1 hypothetical protein SAMN04487890_108209 [Mucilaginibacter polytrichastri]